MTEPVSISGLTFDDRGLIPAIVQDHQTGEILMLAYMNEESLQRTVDTGRTWFWSRSRQELWNKGATSGHFQFVKALRYDCDLDTLLVFVKQHGPACHTGEHTCFHRSLDGSALRPAVFEALGRLFELIRQRQRLMPAGSYTASLFEKGTDTILKKVGEEAAELIVAAKGGERDEIIYEAADLFYHVGVLLAASDVRLSEVNEELLNRWQ